MNADLNHEIRDRLSRNKKRRNRRRLLLVLSLMAVLATSTILASPATALTEDTSGEVVQNMTESASDASPVASLTNEDQSAGAAQDQSDAQDSVQAENLSAPQDDSQNGAQTAEQNANLDGAKTVEQSANLDGAQTADQNANPDGMQTTGLTTDQNATLENATAEADAADTEEEITEDAGREETASQAELAYEDSRMRIMAVRADGNAFPAGMTLSAEAFENSDYTAAERSLRDLVSQKDTDSTTFSIAGFHALQLAPKNEDGSDAYIDGEVRFTAEFSDGLNDAGYAYKEEQTAGNGSGAQTAGQTGNGIGVLSASRSESGTTITKTTKYETSWRLYTFSGSSLNDITDADDTTLSIDSNGACTKAAFAGKSPEGVVLAQIVRKTVTETVSREEVPMPAISFDEKAATENGSVRVLVDADEGTFEEGTTMSVAAVTNQDVLDRAIRAAGGKGAAAAVDIKFTKKDGTAVEPAKPIRVRMVSDVLDIAEKAHVVHVDNEGSADVVAGKTNGADTVSFESDAFSVYAIVYTVDFTFSGYTYSIRGGSGIMLSALAEQLGLRDTKQDKDFDIADVDDVTFSDNRLVTVTKKDGDWELESRKPFTSTEKLYINMKDGSKYEVEVKDEQVDSVDLGQFITKVTTYTKVGENWQENKNILDGDYVQFKIDFGFESGQLQKGQKLTYQIDKKHIHVDKEINGELTQITANGPKTVGTMTVTTDGLITLQLNDSFNSQEKTTGDVWFNGTASLNGSTNAEKVKFGASAAIEISPRKSYDINVDKKGEYDAKSGVLKYNVLISTTKGTGEPIQFEDYLTPTGMSNPEYKNIIVYKKDSAGKQSQIKNLNPVITKEGNNLKLKYTDLPELQSGESYTISYEVPVEADAKDGKVSASNSCKAWNHNVNHDGWNYTQVHDTVIGKDGTYNQKAQRFDWTINVYNPEKKDLAGNGLKDMLSVTGGTLPDNTYPIKLKIVGSDGSEAEAELSKDGSYIFPANMKAEKYTITYSTPSPKVEKGNIPKVSNTVTYEEGDKSYSATKEVTVEPYGIDKKFDRTDSKTDSGEYLHWTADITLPDGEIDLDKLRYSDEMTVWNGSTDQKNADVHYTTPALLHDSQKGLIVKTDGGTQLSEGTDYQILDNTDHEISPEGSDKLTGFQIRFLSNEHLNGEKSILIQYETYADESSQAPGTDWTWKNKGSIPDHNPKEASYRYEKPNEDFSKQVSNTGWPTTYSSKTLDKKYDATNKYVYYRILLKLDKDARGDQEIIDELPAGLKFVDLSKVVYAGNDHWEPDTTEIDPNVKLKDLVTYTNNAEGGAEKITFHLKDGYEKKYGPNPYLIAFYYKAEIEDEDFWKDIHHTQKAYTNVARWNDLSTSVTVNVSHTTPALSKEHELWDEKKKEAVYYLTVNPFGKDLVPGASTLTLCDEMSNVQDVQISFKPDSLQVYAYDGTKPHNLGEPLDTSRYEFSYDADQRKLLLSLPDETPCVVKYVYDVTPSHLKDVKLTNNAKLFGVEFSPTSDDLEVKHVEGGGSLRQQKLDIYKVDSENYAVRLKGVKFDLYQYVGFADNKPIWTEIKKDLTTNDAGNIHLNQNDKEGLQQGYLYKLIETSIGDNKDYQVSNKPYYFIFAKDEDKSRPNQEIWNKIESRDHSGAVEKDVKVIKDDGEIYVPNKKTVITIRKVWLHADHTKDEENTESKVATVKLYRLKNQAAGIPVTINMLVGDQTASSNTVYIKSGTQVSLLVYVPTHTIYSYSINGGALITLNDGEEHIIPLGSPTEAKTYNINVSAWNLQVEKYEYTPGVDETSKEQVGEYTLNDNNAITIRDLPADGDYYYYVEETDSKEKYDVTYSDNNGKIQTGTITVTNTRKPVSISGTKAWRNADDSSNPPRGVSCEFTLYKNGEKTNKSIVLDGIADAVETVPWTATFTNLDQYDSSGNEIQYTIQETGSPAGYSADKASIKDGETITNVQGTTNLSFTKVWMDGSDQTDWPTDKSITVTLYRELIDDQKQPFSAPERVAVYELSDIKVIFSQSYLTSDLKAPNCYVTERGSYQIAGLPSAGTVEKDGQKKSGTWHYYVQEEQTEGYQRPKYGTMTDHGINMVEQLPYASDGQAIINQKESSFVLPSTGGPGIPAHTWPGALLLLLAGSALTVRKLRIPDRRKKGGRPQR